ncbi:MAG: endonuclease/exonuclease/phosphatase family protein [Leptolyngbya sp. SIO3F4]|nr:endonuclease/exonuclease/phosphatase family protein [Leptolyngbya sp. SIO3F4]
MLRLISNITLVLSALTVLLYYGPYLKYRWVFSMLIELLPYLSSVALLSFVLVLLLPILRKQRLRVLLATLLLVICWAPVLSWVGLPSPGISPEGIRVMTYNLWIDNPKVDDIEQSIRHENPDILFLSEITQATMDNLTSRLDYLHSYRTTGGGNALFSRYPILEAATDDFGVKTRGRTFNLVAKLQIANETVTLIGVHPPIPILRNFFHIRNHQLDTLIDASRKLDGKLIVLGDFNAAPWSPYFKRFEQQSQLQNAGRGHWIWATWYFNQTLKTRYIKIPIDHIMSRGFTPLKAWTGMTGGSDHKPVITVLKPLS